LEIIRGGGDSLVKIAGDVCVQLRSYGPQEEGGDF
jgi:hypothetical protein